MTGIIASQFVRARGCFSGSNFIAKLQQSNKNHHFTPRRVRTDFIITAGGGLQALSEHNSNKAVTCSDELTCSQSFHTE